MAQSMYMRRSPSYLGQDHLSIRVLQERKRAQAEAARLAAKQNAPLPWWQQLFPFLADWLPWFYYYTDLAIYQVERAIYYVRYLAAYSAWLIGRYRDALQYHAQRWLFDLDDRLRRMAEQIEAEQQAPYLAPALPQEQPVVGY